MSEHAGGKETGDLVPLLWLCGPSGVGKSTVGWRLFTELAHAGVRLGYLDIDQLGMCYPAPESDPDRHRIKAQNLGAMVTGFATAGAECVLVSGVIDPVHGVTPYVDHISHSALTLCRLRADRDVLAQRLASRNLGPEQVEAMLRESDLLDQSDVAGISVDTGGLTVSEVLQALAEKTDGWPRSVPIGCPTRNKAAAGFTKRPATQGSILWLCGPTGVGKSTVGWRIFEDVRRAGRTAAFVDLEQIGFLRPAPVDDPNNHLVKAANLGAMWQVFHANGAECLVVVGSVDAVNAVHVYRDALSGTKMTLCRLHAGAEQLTQRILRRGDGGGPRLAGDELVGQSPTVLKTAARKATKNGEILEREAIGDFYVNTDGCSVEEAARLIRAELNGWPQAADAP